MDNQQEFMTKLLELGELYDKELTNSTIRLYWRTLKDFTDQQVQQALDQSMRTHKFMPKPSELWELINGSASEIALDEWGRVLNHMRKNGRFGGDKLPPAVLSVVNQLGGWEYLCTLTHKDLEFKGRDFNKIYEGKETRGISNDQQGMISHE